MTVSIVYIMNAVEVHSMDAYRNTMRNIIEKRRIEWTKSLALLCR